MRAERQPSPEAPRAADHRASLCSTSRTPAASAEVEPDDDDGLGTVRVVGNGRDGFITHQP
jgi:hypothetical protein